MKEGFYIDYEKINESFRELLFVTGVPEWKDVEKIKVFKSPENGLDIYYGEPIKNIRKKRK
jgi:hypothetical protein